MRTRPTLCEQPFVSRLLSGKLSEKEAREFETHLSTCERCRQLLEEQTAPPEEWGELRESLRQSGEIYVHSNQRLPNEELEACRRLLGPTDDPRMMGRIGTYEVTGLLGRGGMGVVFKAFDPALNRYIAIKMLAPMFLASGSFKQRFIREAQSAAAVVHEHVVGIHAISEWQGIPYLVMTYVRGESLQTRLATRGQLSLREVLRIGMQIASGLAAAHAQGLIHRDIKPANILLESDVERVMITDFGLARTLDDLRITGSNTLLGTPEYMSPEQARDEPLDFRTDLFSLGCVLYEACTGRSPFRSSTSYGAIRKVIDQSPPSVQSLVPELPEWFAEIVQNLLRKERQDRLASASEVAALLKQCLAHVEQPHLAPLPKSLLPTGRQWFSTPLVRRLVMTAPWIVTACVGSWMLLGQFGQPEPQEQQRPPVEPISAKSSAENPLQAAKEPPTEKTPVEQPAEKADTPQPITNVGKYALKVRKADVIDQLRLSIKPPNSTAMLLGHLNGNDQPQNSTNTNPFQKTEQSSGGTKTIISSGGFSSSSSAGGIRGGTITSLDKVIRPNLGVAFEIDTREKVIFELENLAATDDQGHAVEWMAPGPFNFYDPEFEKQTRGALVAYFQEEDGTDHLKSVTGDLKVTPGRVLEVEFPGAKPGTKKSGEHSFTLKGLQTNGQGIQVSLTLPQLSKPRGNMFGNPEAMMKAMLAQQGAFEVMLEDSEGAIHYSNASGGGSSSGSSSGSGNGFATGGAGGTAIGNGNGGAGGNGNFPNTTGNQSVQNSSGSSYSFAALPEGREIKSLMIRAVERTGKPRMYPFKLDLIPIPYSSE